MAPRAPAVRCPAGVPDDRRTGRAFAHRRPAGRRRERGTGVSPLWYATRATGVVALVLLTATVVMGIAAYAGLAAPGLPRVVTGGLHRNVSLLVLAFVAAHVLTTVLDSYTPIGLVAAFVPFSSSYRPLWLSLGAVSPRPAACAHADQPGPRSDVLPGLAGRARAGLRVLAGRAVARARHRNRQPAAVAAPDRRGVPGQRDGRRVLAAVPARAGHRPFGGHRGRRCAAAGHGRLRAGRPAAAGLGTAGRHARGAARRGHDRGPSAG